MNVSEIILGQLPEAVYFAIFMILVKGLKEKRFIFTISMVIEYLLVLNILPYSIWSYVLYFVLSFLLLKMLYKDKSNVTDIFTMGIASVIIIIVSIFSYFIVSLFSTNVIIGNLCQKVILFFIILVYKSYLPKIKNIYKKLWNRSKHSYKIKSTTFRVLNLIVFNFSFVVINLGIMFYYWR